MLHRKSVTEYIVDHVIRMAESDHTLKAKEVVEDVRTRSAYCIPYNSFAVFILTGYDRL